MLNSDKIQGIGFIVNDRPMAIYGPDLKRHTWDFITTFDVSFWQHQLDLASKIPLEESSHDHVALLRLILAHAQEHLFGLLFAILQAPTCPDLWLYRYQPKDLPQMVTRINNGGHILNRWKVSDTTWEAICRALWKGLPDERYHLTSRLLARLGTELTSNYSRDEYNGIKHGLRIGLGGFSLSFSPISNPSAPHPPESCIKLGSSKFGCSYYRFEEFKSDKSHCRALRTFSNWSLKRIILDLNHTILLIQNLGIPLRIRNGIEGHQQFAYFTGEKAYNDDPAESGETLKMQHNLDFEIPREKRISISSLKKSYT